LFRKTASGTSLFLLLISTLTLAFNTQPVKAEPRTWIVDDDGPADFSSIQDAVDLATSGDTIFVREGIYDEHVTISKPLDVTGENPDATVVNGSFLLLFAYDVCISSFAVNGKEHGIHICASSNCTITSNIVTSSFFGIYLNYTDYPGSHGSGNNIITLNTISDSNYGIGLYWSSNNRIYHNNFRDNTQQVHTDNSENLWDDDYPSGGNYWDDYDGNDFYHGQYQNEPGSDALGDSPYIIDENNIDRYPLMGPFGGSTIKGQNVTAYPSSEICLIFENITSEGTTSVNVTNVGPEPPRGFQLAGNYYNIKSTANYTGTIKIRIVYDDTNMTFEEEMSLHIMQWDAVLQQWVDITTYIDTEYNIVFGETTHLSLFAIFTTVLTPSLLVVSISPLSASIIVGQSVTFNSTVSGGYTPYTYQWFLNYNPVSGATSNTWTFTPTTSGTFYVYLKVTDNKANTAQSDNACITVATVPVGGYSIPIQGQARVKPITPYIILAAFLTIAYTTIKRKKTRKTKHST